jgi:transcriptional regulator with XRE-family HTH domain
MQHLSQTGCNGFLGRGLYWQMDEDEESSRTPGLASAWEMRMTPEQDDVGPLLRHLRRRQQLTLLQLAERIGCSESLLSKIERGHVRPTLRMLHLIAHELDIEVSAVMGGQSGSAVAIYEAGARPRFRLSGQVDGAPPVVLERAIPWREECVLDANLHVIPPGCGSEGAYSHQGEEVGLVISGTVELSVDGRLYRLEPGTSFYFDSRLPHSYINLGTDEAKIFWVNGLRQRADTPSFENRIVNQG